MLFCHRVNYTPSDGRTCLSGRCSSETAICCGLHSRCIRLQWHVESPIIVSTQRIWGASFSGSHDTSPAAASDASNCTQKRNTISSLWFSISHRLAERSSVRLGSVVVSALNRRSTGRLCHITGAMRTWGISSKGVRERTHRPFPNYKTTWPPNHNNKRF